MFNIFNELYIGMAVKEKQNRLEREAAMRRLLAEAQVQRKEPQNGQSFFMQFLALAFKALGTNGQIYWKL